MGTNKIFLCDFPAFVHITTPTVLGNRFNQFKPYVCLDFNNFFDSKTQLQVFMFQDTKSWYFQLCILGHSALITNATSFSCSFSISLAWKLLPHWVPQHVRSVPLTILRPPNLTKFTERSPFCCARESLCSRNFLLSNTTVFEYSSFIYFMEFPSLIL